MEYTRQFTCPMTKSEQWDILQTEMAKLAYKELDLDRRRKQKKIILYSLLVIVILIIAGIIIYNIIEQSKQEVYKTVKIGDQTWLADNLDVGQYSNGDDIPQVQDKT